jgi:hypothetical protein
MSTIDVTSAQAVRNRWARSGPEMVLAQAVASEAAVSFFSVGGACFVEMFARVGAARVRPLFAGAVAAVYTTKDPAISDMPIRPASSLRPTYLNYTRRKP